MLFKIKKFLLPALLSIANHIDYNIFISTIYPIFIKFSTDDIWGVRKVCVEKLKDLIILLKYTEYERLKECVTFLNLCFNDTSKWVKS